MVAVAVALGVVVLGAAAGEVEALDGRAADGVAELTDAELDGGAEVDVLTSGVLEAGALVSALVLLETDQVGGGGGKVV